MGNNLIDRQAAIDALTHKWDGMVTSVFDVINSLPPALPDFDEWCTDCKEYDKERNSCPRWNRVIKETLKDLREERKMQLSEESTTFDCISRQAAINLLKQMRKDGDMVPWEGKDVFARIRKLPSAQADIAEKLYQCKCYIIDQEGLQNEVIYVDDIRRVTGWEI